MNNHENPIKLNHLFEHSKLFHAYRNIFYLSSSKGYMDSTLEEETTQLLERNNKSIENIIYFSLNIKNRLRQILFNDILETVNEIDREIQAGKINNELKNKLKEEKNEILKIFFDEIDETINSINQHNQYLLFEINELKNKFITTKITPFIHDKENNIKKLTSEIINLEHQSEETKKELDIIRDSEDILHKKNFFDLFKNSIPQLSEINNLNIEKQEKNILSSLVKILNNLFSTLDYGFSYTKIVETRHQLTTLYLAQIKKIHQLKKEQQNTLLNLKHHYKLVDIDYFLHILIKQLEFLSEYWKEIILQIHTLKNNNLLNKDIIIPIFSFLDSFSLYYEEVEK
ncbi:MULTISPECIES: alpha-xenorhabdolysin family binary toxin subunit B [Proteus]|uniref:Alpha-xenorhabdolysin family binary toxin subunit B n=1 Tax=Proteus penneri TaxID=102862 RepID=A0ABS0W4Y4_9GAMM|nr:MULTISPECIES: alpha-xenorhabdolysin family binary toxin subunit B [Proteus]MBJ2116953.1 alpha-xenorhabdolysin family binary toxin subunit B [Proteus penneri]NBL91434.1 alpha-xenorhabdolysin family binary toxin subunit B [Proteus sp. G2673]NBM13558.1 alpha-xenorhabdolysin family binary toxin subunit B [Proteus sp. G2670]NBM33690.1 alpha-xenorhabdolysin family binary toxin subunit B [Proteus sp. G2664]NBM70302.1 alpha-xenorhabdolysin family binary toxin subunit B [Proteus sp. G2663]